MLQPIGTWWSPLAKSKGFLTSKLAYEKVRRNPQMRGQSLTILQNLTACQPC